jgi:hypothetical protein
MIPQVKTSSVGVVLIISLAFILSSCSGIRLEQQYYDEGAKTDVLPTSTHIFAANEDGETVLAWLIARRDSIFLVLELQYSPINHHRFHVDKGENLSVQFSDGDKYNLLNSYTTKSRRGTVQGDPDRFADLFIPLSINDMKTLLGKKITWLNVQSDTRNSSLYVKPGNDLALKKMIRIMRPDL